MLVALSVIFAGVAQPAPAAQRHHKRKRPVHGVHCERGQLRLKVGGRTVCVKNSLRATTQTPQLVDLGSGLAFGVGRLRDTHGRRPTSLAKLMERVGPRALAKLGRASALGLAQGEALKLRGVFAAHAASAPIAGTASTKCGTPDQLQRLQKEVEEAPQDRKEQLQREYEAAVQSQTAKAGEAEATVDLVNGSIKLGIDIKGQGIRVEMSMRSCGGDDSLEVDNCPTAQGTLEGHDQREFEVLVRVTEGPKLLSIQGFKVTGETTIKAQTGDDGKLDYFDIKHIYHSGGTIGGPKQPFGMITIDYAYIGEARVDMRSGGSALPPAVVDATITAAGADPHERIAAEIELATKAQDEADKEFAAEVEKVTERLRSREARWLEPNKCASIHFEPDPETLKLRRGQSGTFKSRAEAAGGGATPTATWTLGAQQHATFTPSGSEGNPLSTAYRVTDAGKGVIVSGTLKATSRAGVAEAPWKQKTEQGLTAITGTFSGSYHHEGELVEWTGTATFTVIESLPSGEVLKLSSGEATLTASGEATGTGCQQTGTETVALYTGGLWTLNGEEAPLEYQIVAPWGYPGTMNVTLVDCPPEIPDGTKSTTDLGLAELQSGDVLDGLTSLLKTSSDGKTFDGSATAVGADPGETFTWDWSFTGSS